MYHRDYVRRPDRSSNTAQAGTTRKTVALRRSADSACATRAEAPCWSISSGKTQRPRRFRARILTRTPFWDLDLGTWSLRLVHARVERARGGIFCGTEQAWTTGGDHLRARESGPFVVPVRGYAKEGDSDTENVEFVGIAA